LVESVAENPFSAKESNSSYNGYGFQLNQKLSPTEKKIVAVLRKASIPISPEEIRTKIALIYDQKEIPQGTIRPLLRNLTRRAVIHNPWKGLYCDKLTYDVAVKPIAVHNIRLHCEVALELEHWETTNEYGGVEVHVCLGEKRSLVSGWIKYDRGLSRPACMLAIDKWVEIAESKLGGFKLTDFWLTRLEVNRDEAGMSFDTTLHCATRDVLKDFIVERVYEKEDCLRQEYCIRKDMTVKDLDNLFTQGIDNFMASAVGHEQNRKLSGIEKTQRVINSKLQDIDASNRAIQKKIMSDASSEDSIHRLIVDLADDNRRVMAYMSTKFGETMELLTAKTVETEELKKMVLSISKAAAEVVDALAKSMQPEAIQGNEQNNEAMKEYVQ